MSRPNIILIMADDLGYGDVGCYGNREIKTPNMDALARGGLRFTDYHSNGAVSSPTRAALLTGRYQHRTGIEDVVTAKPHRDTGLPLKEVTFAQVLRSAGYTTALFGKWHLGYQAKYGPTCQGFGTFRGFVSGNVDYHSHIDPEGHVDWWQDDQLRPEAGYSTDLITEYGLRFIEHHKHEPFCLYLSHEAPHYPYQGRNDSAERAPGHAGAAGGSREDKAEAYCEMIEAMDEGIGLLVEKLREHGLERDTLIFFCSDNGPAGLGSSGPFRGGKGTLWEGGHRVPAIAYWPGTIEAGGSTGETVLSMDLFPTMVAMADASPPKGVRLDGADLLPLLKGTGPLPERSLFWTHHEQKAARKGPWKLVVMPEGDGPGETGKPALFHLGDDPGERKDLSSENPDLTARLLSELAVWEKGVHKGVERRA